MCTDHMQMQQLCVENPFGVRVQAFHEYPSEQPMMPESNHNARMSMYDMMRAIECNYAFAALKDEAAPATRD